MIIYKKVKQNIVMDMWEPHISVRMGKYKMDRCGQKGKYDDGRASSTN
jgi:hypothetical protein